jgi:hypothetical protein
MNRELHYAHEKFSSAVSFMATSELPLRERIREARLHFVAVHEDDLPDDARADWRALTARTSWAEDAGGGTIAATLAVVSDLEVRRLADLIVDLHGRIVDALIREGERA